MSEDGFRRFIEQMQQRGASGGLRPPQPPKGAFGAAGAVALLIGGGLLLSNSLFNGMSCALLCYVLILHTT